MINYIEDCKLLITQFDAFSFQTIKKDIENIKTKIKEHELVGDVLVNFQRSVIGDIEYHNLPLSENIIKKKVLELIELHEKKYNYLARMYNFTTAIPASIPDFEFERIWVNFQKPNGFVPLHQHSGLYSFVIWVDIPYTLKQDKILESEDHRVGTFEFVYTDFLGKLTSQVLPVDKTWQGSIAVFPAELYHQVYPYYDSNEYSISISGNLKLSLTSG